MREADPVGSARTFTLLPRLVGGALEKDGILEIQLPDRLELPNRDRGRHWSKKHKLTQKWEHLIAVFGGGVLAPWKLGLEERVVRTATGFRLKQKRRRERRRVTITRIVSASRFLSKDDDNRRYVAKPLLDALNRLALIYDDRREWIEHPEPTELVMDGRDVTIIRIERIALEEKPHV